MMENLNLPPFYVGQKVNYIGNDPRPKNPLTVARQQRFSCGCWAVDCGLTDKSIAAFYCCCPGHSNSSRIKPSDTIWIAAKNLVPIEQTFRSITFEEVIKIESPLIGIN